MAAQDLHTLNGFSPATGKRLLLLLERLGQFNFNSCKAVAEEGCEEFYPLVIKKVTAQLDLGIFMLNVKKEGHKEKVAVGAVAQIPSMAKKRGCPRNDEKKNKEE